VIKPVAVGFLVAIFLQDLPGQKPPIDLSQATLEDLMNIEVTSVSRKAEKLSGAASAIFVITQEDIRRSGALNIPDLLRMAPGVDVEQIDANAWAISIRGFNSRYSNKVLVLVDGRTVYSPVYSGVNWDQLGTPLDTIERIEVIRGPGGSVWGANAVNGVISIISKSSKETKGGQVTAAGGSNTHAAGQLQYGGAIGRDETYRVFADYSDIGNSMAQGGGAANDRWQRMHAGFRSDWNVTAADSVMVQGDLFANRENQTTSNGYLPSPVNTTFPQALDAAGGDLLARWDHQLSGGSQTSLQGYYDTYRRTDAGIPVKVTTFGVDFQDHMAAGKRNDIVWGLGFRSDNSGAAVGYSVGFTPPYRTVSLFSVFLQDEIRISTSLQFTMGAKLEHNAFTGFQTEPSVRLAWSPPASRYTVWAAASKAIRQPNRGDNDVQSVLQTIPAGAGSVEQLRLLGSHNVQAEELRDYELGYRSQAAKNLSLDVATFLSFYHHLETIDPEASVIIPGSPLIIQIPLLYENLAHAMTYGGEVSVTWKAASHWRISPGYSYLHAMLRQDQGLATATLSTDFPRNMVQIRSLLTLPHQVEFDQSLYYTARLPGGGVEGHARLDLRLARRIGPSTEISVVGQNLLRRGALEYGNSAEVVGTQSVRSIYGKITWHF
jgi:iron complex outermembrane receptor protein